ncbi:hypothetical protein ACVWZV_007629 [Bradyrhizobium sp. GM5.1]
MMAFRRRAQLMAHGGEEARLGGVRRLCSAARLIERLLPQLAVGDIAHHGDDIGLARGITAQILIERAAAHLDPDEINLAALRAGTLPAQPELNATHVAARGIGQRRQIRRPIGDMDAIEQAVAEQLRDGHAEHGFHRR